MKYRFTGEYAIARVSGSSPAAAAGSPRPAIVSRHPGIPTSRHEDGTLSRALVDRLGGRSVGRSNAAVSVSAAGTATRRRVN